MSRLLSLALMAFSLVVSSAAWAAHSVNHGADLVTAEAGHGQHLAAFPGKADQGGPGQDKQDGGHDHLLSLFFPVAALFDDAQLQHPPLPAADLPPIADATLALRAPDPPPADPPRTF
jgi:hypothetical protein